MQISFAQALSS